MKINVINEMKWKRKEKKVGWGVGGGADPVETYHCAVGLWGTSKRWGSTICSHLQPIEWVYLIVKRARKRINDQ